MKTNVSNGYHAHRKDLLQHNFNCTLNGKYGYCCDDGLGHYSQLRAEGTRWTRIVGPVLSS